MWSFLKKIYFDAKYSLKAVYKTYRYLYLHTYDLLNFIFGKDIIYLVGEDDSRSYLRHTKLVARERLFIFLKNFKFYELDIIELKFILNIFDNIFIKLSNPVTHVVPRYIYRVSNYNYKPYTFFFSPSSTPSQKLDFFKLHYYSGFKSIWRGVRSWVISLIIALTVLLGLSYIRVLPVNTVLFQWFALAMFLYWLLSGFVFFIKKYQFTRFTSVIQRFWRRSYILFWLIESCLLVVFLYLTLNATQESIYMLDQIQVFKNHLFSWRLFLPKLFLLSLLIILGYLLLLNLKWNIFRKHIPIIIAITALLTYMLWVEFYQIFHVSNFYANLFWSYDVEDKMWVLESDVRRTRIVNHYVMILYILKFWHIVFIYGFWIFFILRSNELSRVRYPIYSANFQNFIILYIMGWLFMYPWFKFTFHKFLEGPYYWFYINTHRLGIRVFFYDLKLIGYGLLDYFSYKNSVNFNFNYFDFFYWSLTSEQTGYLNFRKHTIRNFILTESLA